MKLNIGNTFKKFRKEKNLTQKDFANVPGVTCQSVSRLKNNSCYPSIDFKTFIFFLADSIV